MAYEIIKQLQANNDVGLLQKLSTDVELIRKANKKLLEVWASSFDWKDCRNNTFIWQKLNYMHSNICTGKRGLSANTIEYLHSSEKFYLTGLQGVYPITNFMEMEAVNFNLS